MSDGPHAQNRGTFERMDAQERLSYGPRIKSARLVRNMTQADLAEISGVARNTIGNVESGKTAAQPENLWRLAEALDIVPDPVRSYPEHTQDWINLTAPLFTKIADDTTRVVILGETLARLGNAVKNQTDHRL